MELSTIVQIMFAAVVVAGSLAFFDYVVIPVITNRFSSKRTAPKTVSAEDLAEAERVLDNDPNKWANRHDLDK